VVWDEAIDNGAVVTAYELQIKKNDVFVPIFTGNVKRFVVRELTPSTNYDFRARARNFKGDGPYSETGRVTTAGTWFVCVYVCVCMCVYVCVYMYMYVYVICICMCMDMCMCMYVYMCVCICVCVCM